MTDPHPFFDDKHQPRVLKGCTVYTGSARAAELAGQLGFDVVWIDLEHASCDVRQAESLCIATRAGGALPLVRTAGQERDHILHALEVGGRIVVVPMVEDAAAARRIVEYGKYPPLGRRGYYRLSRGLGFGLESDWLAAANQNTVLMPQVETLKAVEQLDAILSVEGIDGVLLGPGDLSADLGKPGDFENPRLLELLHDCFTRIAATGKFAGIMATTPAMAQQALHQGANLIICTGDLPVLVSSWTTCLANMNQWQKEAAR